MPEDRVGTPGTPGAGPPGPAGQPGQAGAQPAAPAAPPSAGTAPAAPPPQGDAAAATAAGGAAPTAPPADPWGDAAKWRRQYEEGERRRKGQDRTITDLQRQNEELRRQMEQAKAAPAPAAEPPPTAQPAPSAAAMIGLTAQQLDAWAGSAWQRAFYGYEEREIVTDPQTGQPALDPNTGQVVQRVRRVEPDPRLAHQIAQEMDALYRQKGTQPPWAGQYNFGQPVQAPEARPSPAVQPDQPAPVTWDQIEQWQQAQEDWERNFDLDLAKVSADELGEDFFGQVVTVEVGGQSQQMTRERALHLLCRPTRQFPSGRPLRAGLLEFFPGETFQRRSDIAFQQGRASLPAGAIPGAADAGPPLDPTARQERAQRLMREDIAGGAWSPEPPKDAARVVRVPSAGGRSHGLPRV